jgi:hypothetical protein
VKHAVSFSVPTRDLGKADIDFMVKVDGKAFGKLEVSKGSVVWYPQNTTWGHKASWSRFDQLMREARRTEKRKARRARKKRTER